VSGAAEWLYSAACGAVKALLPFEWAQKSFMHTPFLTIVVVALLTAVVGTIVVNARMAFFTSAIGHSAFSGVAAGILMGITDPGRLTLVMVGFGCLAAVLITWLGRRSSVPPDSLVGVVQTLAVAAGIVVITAFRFQRTEQFLFGDVLFATKGELGALFLTFLVLLVLAAPSYNRLLLIGLNSDLAQAWGVRTRAYEYLFAAAVAVVVMMCVNAVGVLLVTAMIIIPAAAGRNFAWSAGSMFWMSLLVSLVSGVGGFAGSWYLKAAAGATIVLAAGVLFALSYVVFALRRRTMRRRSVQEGDERA